MKKIEYMKYPNKPAEEAIILDEYKQRAEIFSDLMIEEFFALCKIPHPSGHVEKMRRYLYQWGIDHNLETTLDDSGCVYIDIPASPGNEVKPGIIFQSHYDMVAVAAKDNREFVKTETPIVPYLDNENGCIHTKWRTSLGADDGHGIATSLAIARLHQDPSFDFTHGPIRLLFTYDEETTMQGVVHLTKKAINTRYIINLDSIYVGMILVSAAGALSATITKRMQTINAGAKGRILNVNIWGLTGGHSGEDIDKGRGSTSAIITEMLERMYNASINFNFQHLDCGTLMNAIPSKMALRLIVGSKDIVASKQIAEDVIAEAQRLYVDGKDLKYEIADEQAFAEPMLTISDSIRIWRIFKNMPNGVISTFDNGKPRSSCNVGHIQIKNGLFQLDFLYRSVSMLDIDTLNEKLRRNCHLFHMDYTVHGRFHAWPPMDINPLNELFKQGYREVCGFEPAEVSIHSGLECGYLCEKYPDLIMASVGCDIINEHTRKETLFTGSLPAHMATLLFVMEHFHEHQAEK